MTNGTYHVFGEKIGGSGKSECEVEQQNNPNEDQEDNDHEGHEVPTLRRSSWTIQAPHRYDDYERNFLVENIHLLLSLNDDEPLDYYEDQSNPNKVKLMEEEIDFIDNTILGS